MKLIVGLGNPGKKYEKTRHNMGFMALDRLADGAWTTAKKCNASVARITQHDEDILLAKPQTFMNASGDAVAALMRYYAIEQEDILVAYDEIDLMLGDIRLRPAGASGGHNGVASIIDVLGDKNFQRMRIGIAEHQPGKQDKPSEAYVLEPFSKNRMPDVRAALSLIPEIVTAWQNGVRTHTFHTPPKKDSA